MRHDVARGRAGPLIGSLIFFVIAPGTLAGFIPYRLTGWHVGPASRLPMRAAGAVTVLAGLTLLIDCFLRFALEGRGTPAPVAPTEKLIVSGTYRHVRNPIYLAVVSIVVGQAAFFASAALMAYAVLIWLAFHVFVLLYEEPVLHRQFGRSYEAYVSNVGRWLPRASPWLEHDQRPETSDQRPETIDHRPSTS
jgi:protein-S-isoprenylcysteine O-methyltransferase Ste14